MFKARFEIGDKVIVASLEKTSREYPYDLIGEVGTIKERFVTKCECSYGVSVPGFSNPMSKKNYFWLSENNLKIPEYKIYEKYKKENEFIMKDAKFVTLINPAKINEITVGAYYGELKAGDIVVCDYEYGNNALSVRIVGEEVTDAYPDCVIMGVADTKLYFERKERMARRAELKEQMIAQAEKYREEEYWRIISESDPAMKALYDEFKKLED